MVERYQCHKTVLRTRYCGAVAICVAASSKPGAVPEEFNPIRSGMKREYNMKFFVNRRGYCQHAGADEWRLS